jgi:type I restriction enzyme S subunit
VVVSYGKALSARVRSNEGEIPVVGSSGVVGRHNEELVDGPCLVVGRKGAAGAVHLIGQSSWPIDTAYFIQPPLGIDLRYLYFFLGSQQLGQLDKSTAIPSISRDDLYKVQIPIAPQSEQTRIVEKLDELLSDLDAGVAELKAAQRKLAQYRQSLLKAAVEGTLTADWRKARAQSGEPQETGADLLQRILTERRTRWETKQLAKFASLGKTPPTDWKAKYTEPSIPNVPGLASLPLKWTWATIDQIADVGTGVTPLRSKLEYFKDGTLPWITSGALNDEIVSEASEHVTPLAMEECRLELYPAGSLLVAMYGEGKTRGKCSELAFPATINQAIAAMVLEGHAEAVHRHVKTFLHDAYEAMRKKASGGVQPNLNLQIIKSLTLPLPPLDEQIEIQNCLAEQLVQYKELQEMIEHGLKQSAAQRKNILKAAFAGQLVPQDPNDEPASVLLERIRAQRVSASVKRPVKNGRKPKEKA